jgi:hypothetical protein
MFRVGGGHIDPDRRGLGIDCHLNAGKYSPATWMDLTISGLALGGVYA